jgi:hypothetical protein
MENISLLLREFLKNGGINVQEVGNGRLSFSVNNLNFISLFNDNDPYFLRLALPKINRDEINISNYSDKIQQLNRNYKVAKIVTWDDGTLWVIADIFVYSLDKADLLIKRLIQAMTDIITDYRIIESKDSNGNIQS